MNKFHTAACAIMGFWLCLSGASIAADNSIKQVQFSRTGDQILLKVQMAAPLKAMPGNWSVVEPPRVVIDFPGTDNQSGQTTLQVGAGDLKSLNLVQTDTLTRLVLNLYRPTKFSTEIDGDVLFVKLQGQAVQASQEPAPSVYQATPPPGTASRAIQPADTAAIRDIGFRRGEDGQGTITIELTDGTVPIDVRRVPTGLAIELRDVELPERLQNRRDVNDFATPVTTITSRAMGNLTRLDVAARGRWFHQAHLANNLLSIEIRPIPADDANKLVQTGQQGQKVSINFFNADATMVLRTLADISGKNVLIDPSLNGRSVTANLDNIPYDQALEIIMAQVNAGMRVRNDVVLFGDRAVLQKRDQDTADELTRASDIAPLVAETFKLNYVKASDIVTLVNSSFATATDADATPPAPGASGVPAAAPGAAAGAPAAGAAAPSRPKGMLTARGGISIHAATNQVFVRDTAGVIEAIREIIRNIDVPPRQVMIEARIVEASTGFGSSLGVRLGAFASQNNGYRVPGTNTTRAAVGTAPPTGFVNADVIGNDRPFALTTNHQVFRAGYNLATAANFGLMLFNAAATKLVTLELAAAESDSKNKAISAPKIITLNRKAATINFTQTQSYSTGFNATTGLATYSTISAPISLSVTPSINPDNRIGLDLNITKATLVASRIVGLPPGVDSNSVTTNVIVENGGTVVIGGFSIESEEQTQERVPFLGDLPYVGFLFKTTIRNQKRGELLVFITPRIISEALTQR